MQTSTDARQTPGLPVGPAPATPAATRRGRLAMLAAGVVLLANVVVPLVWGDLYPFTSAPMFRDAPQLYCNYTVFATDGRMLGSVRFGCHRVYDGNPVGYGVGRLPPTVLDQFGAAPDGSAVRNHIRAQLKRAENRGFDQVDVVQEVLGPTSDGRIDIVRSDRWRVTLDEPQP